jgi:hypothetical protein
MSGENNVLKIEVSVLKEAQLAVGDMGAIS